MVRDGEIELYGRIKNMIEPIVNNEVGSSVRAKLNEMIDIVNKVFVLTAITTDATQTEMLVNGVDQFIVPPNTTWGFSIMLVARDGTIGSAIWKIEGGIQNGRGNGHHFTR